MKWHEQLQEEIRKAIIAELRKIVEENPLPEPHFESVGDPHDKRYCSFIVRNEDKFYIGSLEDNNVSE